MAAQLMCPICGQKQANLSTVFCDADQKLWLASPERYAVDWGSSESYDAELAQFVDRIRKERGLTAATVTICVKRPITLKWIPIRFVVPPESGGSPAVQTGPAQANDPD